MKKILIGILALVITIIIWVFIFMSNFELFGKSENRLIKEFYNPKESMKVVVFEKLGNATVNNSIQASIRGYNYELTNEEIGNVFVADHFEGLKTIKDSLLIINWIDNETVKFNYPKKLRIFKTENQFKNNIGKVIIEYKTTE